MWFALIGCLLNPSGDVWAGSPVGSARASEGLHRAACPQVPIWGAELLSTLESQHRLHGVPAGWVAAVIQVESAWKLPSQSPAGAIGLMQLMPDGAAAGAAECGLSTALMTQALRGSPAANVEVGACLLRAYLIESGGSWLHTLALYNGGYVQEARLGHPSKGRLAAETQAFIVSVLTIHEECIQ